METNSIMEKNHRPLKAVDETDNSPLRRELCPILRGESTARNTFESFQKFLKERIMALALH